MLSTVHPGEQLAASTAAMTQKLNQSTFEAACPSLLYMLVHRCLSNTSSTVDDIILANANLPDGPSQIEIWGFGFLFMALISLTTLGGLLVLPFRKTAAYDLILIFLVALAMGCLVGNGVFVLIPEAFEIVHHKLYLWKSFTIVSGIYLFYVMERVMKLATSNSSHRHSSPADGGCTELPLHHHHHHHHHGSTLAPADFLVNNAKPSFPCEDSSAGLVDFIVNDGDPVQTELCLKSGDGVTDTLVLEPQNVVEQQQKAKPVAAAAYMVLFGHGVHNFIDGMSIGAAFTANKLLGISLSLAVICEEIPHGLGDFAILLNAGMSKRKAVLYNFLSGCPCYFGLVVGIKLAEVMHAAPWILGIAGGIFIYIGLGDMLPEMNATEEDSPTPIKIFLIQNAGILCGATVIAIMAIYGKDISVAANSQFRKLMSQVTCCRTL